MVSIFIAFGFSINYLNQTVHWPRILGGLVVRVEDYRSGTPSSNRPRHIEFIFPLKLKRLAL